MTTGTDPKSKNSYYTLIVDSSEEHNLFPKAPNISNGGIVAIPRIAINAATRDKDHSKQLVIRKLITLKQQLISTYNKNYKGNVVKVEKVD